MSLKKIILVIFLIAVGALLVWYFFGGSIGKNISLMLEKKTTVNEQLEIPDTKSVAILDGRLPNTNAYDTPIAPNSPKEEVVVPGAVLTLKEAYAKSEAEALIWGKDAKLIFIKSLGAVTLDGRSSQWQVVFGSKTKKKGYEIIIQKDLIVSKKEIESKEYGYDLPKNWYDAKDAILSIQTMPQFKQSTISGMNFYYNKDGKIWGYALATSNGTVSVPVR
ncbi:hypothetical protein HY249_02930 [Candidatus Azambacteria bacterium]|nr:hypothetical protein [Candidatus Azambacteria bacterium]